MATKKATTTKADLSVFNLEVSPALLTQAIFVYQENSHQGTSKVKTRGELNISKRKVYKQKGTGNARHGTKSAPIYVGGGVVFGPTGINAADKDLNKKMKLKALAGIVSLYNKENRLSVIDSSELKKISSKSASELIGKEKVALVHFGESEDFLKSMSNLKTVTLRSARRINAFTVSQSPKIVLTQGGYDQLVERLKNVLKPKTK